MTHITRLWVTAALATGLSSAVIAQTAFDPHDLSGIWQITKGHRSISPNVPPMTAEGDARLNANKPTRGRFLGQPLNGEHPGFVRAVPVPALGNDPAHKCNPNGFPRLLLDPEPVEFVQTRGRLLQLFQWERTLRELWMDGRAVPSGESLDNLGPAWYGHTAGGWQGNTLVLNTVGLDDRAWIDIFGFPKSASARIEERYTRTAPDTIELRLTLYDPAFYTQPWVSDVKTYTRVARQDTTFYGWYGLFSGLTEGICAPMNEVDSYNSLFRDRTSQGVIK
ncbi:MAG: hypothetical protein HOP16_03155 [Acidobacteria bacterium]|nr:hypothetical protein [Acidobacteriota bacterium]